MLLNFTYLQTVRYFTTMRKKTYLVSCIYKMISYFFSKTLENKQAFLHKLVKKFKCFAIKFAFRRVIFCLDFFMLLIEHLF